MAKLIIFDVGGVLVELRPDVRRAILSDATAPDALPAAERAELNAANRAFCRGFMAEAAFIATVTRLLNVTPETFARAEDEFIALGDRRMLTLAQGLRTAHRVVCLSNTQPTHWRHVMGDLLGAGFFDHEYVSHEMGLEKPDPAIYARVAAAEGVAAADIIFIDDTPDNLPPARALGWGTVIHHTSFDATLAAVAAALDA